MILIPSTLWANSANDKSMVIFISSYKTCFDIACNSLHEISKPKRKKNISKYSEQPPENFPQHKCVNAVKNNVAKKVGQQKTDTPKIGNDSVQIMR